MSIPSPASSSGEVIYLAGPSSTGKSTFSSELINNGWLHLEADKILSVTEITHVEKNLGPELALIRKTLSKEKCTPEGILRVVMGDRPEIPPENQEAFNKARDSIKACLDLRWKTMGEPDQKKAAQNWQEIFIALLEDAKKASSSGKNVIIDMVGMIGERQEVSAPGLKIVKESPNLWDYKGLKIEQYLKYASFDRLVQNIFSRNQKGDSRPAMYVLDQYGERFKQAKKGDDPIGCIKISDLSKWIERFVKIEHLKINYTEFTDFDKIDEIIQAKIKDLSFLELEEIGKKISAAKIALFKKMEIDSSDPDEIPLTFRTTEKAKPKIV